MIKYYNRILNQYETENVAGDKYINWTYSSPLGMNLLNLIVKKKIFSYLYGKRCDTVSSRGKIPAFIKQFDIDMTLFKKDLNEFTSFNDFFTREIKSYARPINKGNNILVSPADGRVLAYENIDINNMINIKGFSYTLKELVQNDAALNGFNMGTCIIIRLCPTDYHRFHFVDGGICSSTTKIKGNLYSVNPIALNKIPKIFCSNKREWSIFHSDNFKDILFLEVGATCVGTIIQTYKPDKRIEKGNEKGYFKFGGSTVVLFFQKASVRIDKDILTQTELGYETKVNMGEKIGETF